MPTATISPFKKPMPLPADPLGEIVGESDKANGAAMAGISDTEAAAGELKQFVERVERLEEEKKAIADDIKQVFGEMKGRGYDVKAVRQIIRIRKQDQNERQEMEAILELYLSALGMA